MTNLELYLIHIIFIAACVYFSYTSGRDTARREFEDFIIRETQKRLDR